MYGFITCPLIGAEVFFDVQNLLATAHYRSGIAADEKSGSLTNTII